MSPDWLMEPGLVNGAGSVMIEAGSVMIEAGSVMIEAGMVNGTRHG